MNDNTIKGWWVDLFNKEIIPSEIIFSDGKILEIKRLNESDVPAQYILLGFVDAHIHVESSMLSPFEFARIACTHGTIATISDPHEIANVCGMDGVRFMIENSKNAPVKIFYGAPSCVPATNFETAGAVLDSKDIKELMNNPNIWYLSEVMNYPGVLNNDPELMAKIQAAKDAGKPIDGHAPGLKGKLAHQYASHGISTDHECFTLEEALDKIDAGMKILIREGSAARNYEALAPLLKSHPDKVMFCSDDQHPDELVLGHINLLVKRAIKEGYDLFDVLNAACVHPVNHYNIPVGLLRVGDNADFIVVDNLTDFNVLETYNNGFQVAKNGKCNIDFKKIQPINHFKAEQRKYNDFAYTASSDLDKIRVIEVLDGQLITQTFIGNATVVEGNLVSNTSTDILKIVVVNRYEKSAPVAIGFVRNFGLQKGAIASSVAHDSHNIIAIGVNDEEICKVVNVLIENQGGIAVVDSASNYHESLSLEIAGLMSIESGEKVAQLYHALDLKTKDLGCTLKAPFMSMSFLALLVIPSLKLSDKGLFDGNQFVFTSIEV
ncbi:MAG TPA: adenine deaminase [Chitinophagales bacterium]|nr:adenine deaminase [Chitinophagales bacterium]